MLHYAQQADQIYEGVVKQSDHDQQSGHHNAAHAIYYIILRV